MRRDRSVDVSLVVGVVLASVVFVTGLAAVSSFAAKATESPITRSASQGASPESAGHSGFRLEMDLHAGEVVPGGRVEYRVFYENLGVVTEPVHITDTLPLWSDFGGAWWGEGDQPNAGEPLTGTVVMDDRVAWDLGQLEGGGARWFHVQVWLGSILQAGQTVTNTTEIAPTSFETSLDDNLDIRVDVLNDFGPNLAVSKAHEWSLPGYDKLNYSIRFRNLGTSGQTMVLIEDTLPATTTYGGQSHSDFPGVIPVVEEQGRIVWEVLSLEPGATGWITFEALLDEPGVPLQFFTNTVQIESQAGDVDPGDNQYEDVAFSGNSITEVHLWAETEHSSVWGFAHEYAAIITGTIQLEVGDQTLWTGWDLTCGGCWEFPDVGPILAGDTITVTAGAGIPVVIAVPDPIMATADSDTDLVWGQIDHLDGEPVEVALDQAGTLLVTTDNNGSFAATFPNIPNGDQGEVRYATEIDWAKVVFHRRVFNPDVVINVNYAHDWVEGKYEVGHTVWITVTESDGSTVKATSQLETWLPPWWGWESGFTTQIENAWSPAQPDIQPGDWVYVTADSGESAEARVGTITGELNYNTDVISGTVTAPWLMGLISVDCQILEEGGPGNEHDNVDPNGGSYDCDFSGDWDLQPGHSVQVSYDEPDNHNVINIFQDLPPQLGITKRGEGQPTTGGNFEYVVNFWNAGGDAAESTVITDTLPAGVNYVGNTSPYTVTLTVTGTQAIAVFDVGILDPDVEIDFSLFTQINAPITSTITNTVEIAASNVVTATLPGPTQWGNPIQPNDTHLNVRTDARPANPAPDEDLLWDVTVCNNGSTSSATAVVTYTVPAEVAIQFWWADDPGWIAISSDPQTAVVTRPTISGQRCSTVHLKSHVDPNVFPGQVLCGTSVITSTNDLEPGDNLSIFCVEADSPHANIAVEKRLHSGVPIPGGRLDYELSYFNTGNQPVLQPVSLTDTLPIGTVFDSAWIGDGLPFDPVVNTGDLVVWEIPEIGVGESQSFFVRMNIGPDVPVGSPLTNTVQITPLPGEDSYDDNTSDAVARVNPPGPNLAVAKWHEWRVPDLDQLAYEIGFWNLGTEPVSGFVITDTLPLKTAWSGWWESDDPEHILGFQNVPGGLFWELSNLAPGERGWIRFAADLDEPATPGRFFVNTVEISMPPGEIDPEDNLFEDLAFVGGEPVADVTIRKLTNGEDAKQPPGPFITAGEPVTWTYAITNTGNVTVTAVTVVDDQPGVIPDCPFDTLGPGEQGECTASGVAVEGQYVNVGTAVGTPPVGDPVEVTDPSHYFGQAASIELTKRTNGEDADDPPGPYVPVGEPVTWTYAITNTGNVTVTAVTVVDDQPGVIPDCPFDTLGPGEQKECTASSVAIEGQYENVGTAFGTPPMGDPVTANDASHYFGTTPSIKIRKATNGEDSDAPPGPYIPVGEPVTWTYVITNTGNITLTAVAVVDDHQGVTPDCPGLVLAPQDWMECTASGVAVAGQYQNIGTATGSPPIGDPVGDRNHSHYFGLLAGPLFEDGFESGDTSAWSRTVP